jgi:hypothetical protein
MITSKHAFVFTLALITACASDSATAPDDPSLPNPDDPSPIDPLPVDTDATGTYALKSTYDLATNAPGRAGEVARAIIAATDDPDDPTSWLLDQAIAQIPNDRIRNFLAGVKPFVAQFLNDRLLDIAPDFVSTMVTIGNDFGQVSKSFGLDDTLVISKSADGLTAVHTVTGARFKIDNVESSYPFRDYAISDVTINGVGVAVETSGKVTLASHKVPLAYGAVLRVALDGAIVPSIDPSATGLGQLFEHQVNCSRFGEAIDDYVREELGFSLGTAAFSAACRAGMNAAATAIYSKIADLDGTALEFEIAGTARGLDKNGDHALDTIQSGAWTGTVSYGTTPAPLAGATFSGTRK